MTTFHCLGFYTTIDSKTSGSYICEVIDKGGDKFMVRGTTEGPKGKAEAIVGTGKYEGMVRTGTIEPLGAFPPIKPDTFTGCTRQTGTYKFK